MQAGSSTAGHGRRGERRTPASPVCLQVVDRAGAQRDRQPDPAGLAELVGVHPQRQAVPGGRPQVALGLRRALNAPRSRNTSAASAALAASGSTSPITKSR